VVLDLELGTTSATSATVGLATSQEQTVGVVAEDAHGNGRDR
jgi:hypothetical protein